jgi:Na+/H+ antiporter NhaD/arsenite permease-like protein
MLRRRTVLTLGGVVFLALAAIWISNRAAEAGQAPTFTIAIFIFLMVFVLISLRWMHETAAALLGAVLVMLVHYVGGKFFPSLQLIGFEEAMTFVDWNVIFLVLGMMILIAMLSETGLVDWLAFRAYRLARGNAWVLGMVLILLTGTISAFMNNVTAILLLVPLSIQITQTLGVHPFSFVIPMVLASNIGGAATIIGDPPSTIVGSHIGLGFVEYLVNMAPIAVICMIILLIMTTIYYRQEFFGERKPLSAAMEELLEKGAQIKDRKLLRRTGLVGITTMIFFLVGDWFELPPSVIALTGAVALITWVRPDMQRMLREVDWTTLFFFIGIFIVVGALEQAEVITWLAGLINDLAAGNPTVAKLLMIWIPGVASGIVDNIPFTVAVLPIADFLTNSIPGIGENVLYWGLILGADLGGNSTYIGSAPNIVALGLLAQAGYRLSFGRFMRDGVPVTLVTLSVGTIWLLLRY